MTFIPEEGISFGDNAAIDAFGRLRASTPLTLFDSKLTIDNQPLFWDDQETSGTGTSSTHSAAKAAVTMAVSDSTAGERTRQSIQSIIYQPGKSQLVLMTFKFGASATGITRSVGQFYNDNGIFLQQTSSGLSVVVRSAVSGSPVDNSIAQNDWNIDKLDGSGDSKITLDPEQTQILMLDYEWLGVGRVRIGFVIGGVPIYCHQFLNSNVNSTVYMSTPNLPLRYQIANDGSGPAANMDCICAQVSSEGGFDSGGFLRSVDTGATNVNVATGTLGAILAIRLKSTALRSTGSIEGLSIYVSSSAEYRFALLLNPTITGSFSFSSVSNSILEIATPTPALSVTDQGTILESGHTGQANNTVGQVIVPESFFKLGSKIDGTADIVALAAQKIGSGGENFHGALQIRELT